MTSLGPAEWVRSSRPWLLRHGFQEPRLVDVQQDQDEQKDEDGEGGEHEARERLRAQRPDEEEHGLQIKEDEDDGDGVVLDGDCLHVQRVYGGRAALERLQFDRGGGGLGGQQPVQQQRDEHEAQDRRQVKEEDDIGTYQGHSPCVVCTQSGDAGRASVGDEINYSARRYRGWRRRWFVCLS